jgi:hypothetical protein
LSGHIGFLSGRRTAEKQGSAFFKNPLFFRAEAYG